jgi:hypothetical protein
VIEKLLTVIIRTSGERTAGLCKCIVEKQISSENIHLINSSPFTEALRESIDYAISKGRKWSLMLDADVLILPGVLNDLTNYADKMGDGYFFFAGKIIDKFLPSPRIAGNHLYRTEYLSFAKQFIPNPYQEIRPESFMIKKVQEKGLLWKSVDYLVGFHDFEQYYRDIYRKSFIHSKKHYSQTRNCLSYWRDLSNVDEDFLVALKGFMDGMSYKGKVSIDTESEFLLPLNASLKRLGVNEKSEISEKYLLVIANVIRDMAALLEQKEKEIKKNRHLFSRWINSFFYHLRIIADNIMVKFKKLLG